MDAETQRVALSWETATESRIAQGLKQRIITFGYGHTDPVTGERLADTYAIVKGGIDRDTMWKTMKASIFADRWAFDYDDAAPTLAMIVEYEMKLHCIIQPDGSIVRVCRCCGNLSTWATPPVSVETKDDGES